MKYVKVLIQVETGSFLQTTRATFEISELIAIEYGNPLSPDRLKADLKRILSLIGEKESMITFYLQTANEGQYPYTTLKGHRYVQDKSGLRFSPLKNGMFEHWHNVNTKHLQGRIMEYIENANDTMLKELRNLAIKQ